MARVSVIVPTYNIQAHIAQTLDSVLSQEVQDLEVIVVDDGSTDATCAIVESYGARVRLIRQANAGVCNARNHGLRVSTGEFVCFLDHDDYWFPSKLALQLSCFEQDPDLGIVFSEFAPWRPDAREQYAPPITLLPNPQPEGLVADLSGWIYHRLLITCWVLTSTAMLRRSALDACGSFDESLPYAEDWDLWLRMSRQYRFAKLGAVTTLYRQMLQQSSRTPRVIDYRSELLERAIARWGYTSPDGRSTDKIELQVRLARYRIDYGLGCLIAGQRSLARKSLYKGWLRRKSNPRPLAYIAASWLGWTPSPPDISR